MVIKNRVTLANVACYTEHLFVELLAVPLTIYVWLLDLLFKLICLFLSLAFCLALAV